MFVADGDLPGPPQQDLSTGESVIEREFFAEK
jgi:hypothetical protein